MESPRGEATKAELWELGKAEGRKGEGLGAMFTSGSSLGLHSLLIVHLCGLRSPKGKEQFQLY